MWISEFIEPTILFSLTLVILFLSKCYNYGLNKKKSSTSYTMDGVISYLARVNNLKHILAKSCYVHARNIIFWLSMQSVYSRIFK